VTSCYFPVDLYQQLFGIGLGSIRAGFLDVEKAHQRVCNSDARNRQECGDEYCGDAHLDMRPDLLRHNEPTACELRTQWLNGDLARFG